MTVLGLAFMALIAYLASLKFAKNTVDDALDRAGRAARRIESIAEKFQTGTITKTFQAALPEISPTGLGNLELARADAVETFRAEDEKSIFWNTLPLGKTVSEIRVPVTYRYHLKLAEAWKLEVSGQTCVVVAPRIRPTLPPAIHTDRLEKKSEAGWGRFNAREQLEELEKGITPTLTEYALNGKHLGLVREHARKTVAEFVKVWLMKEDHWRSDRFHAVTVLFADEAAADPAHTAPTLRLDREAGAREPGAK